MSKNKNSKINRKVKEVVDQVKIGDVFEREGSLHMRVNICHEKEYSSRHKGLVPVCNLNTGSVWYCDVQNVTAKEARDCVISYECGSPL